MSQIRLSGEPRIGSGPGIGVQSMGFKRADPDIDGVYPIMDPLVTSVRTIVQQLSLSLKPPGDGVSRREFIALVDQPVEQSESEVVELAT